MLHQRLSLTVAVLAGLGLRRVTAHGYCVKFAVGSVSHAVIPLTITLTLYAQETYAGFDPTWEGGPSVLGPTPQRPADNVNTGKNQSLLIKQGSLTDSQFRRVG
jgi:hypothetical protein